jgi:hypothetical protein|tara:strand:+ start:111 stop:581 length:471 start_codon:yes stop_codon:yes gene_type:complete
MRGQIQQVFIYLLTIIVVGLILLIGYKSIGGIMKKGCEVEKATFKVDIESFISKYNSYGSVHTESLKAPCSYAQICFVDKDILDNNNFNSSNPIIESSVRAGIEENIFLVKKEVTDAVGFMEEINVDEEIVCINNTGGKFKIRFEGLGKETGISRG